MRVCSPWRGFAHKGGSSGVGSLLSSCVPFKSKHGRAASKVQGNALNLCYPHDGKVA